MTVVDASAWVSAFVDEDTFHVASQRWLEDQIRAAASFAAPTLALVEVPGAIARRTGDPQAGLVALRSLLLVPRLQLVPMDEQFAVRSGELAAQLRLRGADAVYVEVARLLSEPLLTWDRELRTRAASVVACLNL